jgi:hypothetical protein
MNDILLLEEPKRLQNLDCKPSDQTQRHTPKVVGLDKLIQIDREQLK